VCVAPIAGSSSLAFCASEKKRKILVIIVPPVRFSLGFWYLYLSAAYGFPERAAKFLSVPFLVVQAMSFVQKCAASSEPKRWSNFSKPGTPFQDVRPSRGCNHWLSAAAIIYKDPRKQVVTKFRAFVVQQCTRASHSQWGREATQGQDGPSQ